LEGTLTGYSTTGGVNDMLTLLVNKSLTYGVGRWVIPVAKKSKKSKGKKSKKGKKK
jgi:hypothetical protein